MSLLLSRLRLGKPALVRRSSLLLLLSNDFSSSLRQTPPCSIIGVKSCGGGLGRLAILYANQGSEVTDLDKRVPRELVYNSRSKTNIVTIGASHGWVATLKDDGILRLQDDLNPVASDIDPKRIPLPPLVTLPHCQTQIVTNVAMSSSSPEDEDCVVAVKFLGPQLSFCRPAYKPEWTNIKIENPCFYSSRVMFSKKHDMFRIPGSGGHLVGSWDPCKDSDNPKLQSLRFQNLPRLPTATRELLDSCCTSQHLVESRTTGETFLVKLYKKTVEIVEGFARMKTQGLMVFKLDDEGNAVYTQDIGDLCIFISKNEPFCVPASSFPGLDSNTVEVVDSDENATIDPNRYIVSKNIRWPAPYCIPPQNMD